MKELCGICDHPLMAPHTGYRINGIPFCSERCAMNREKKVPCECPNCRLKRAFKSHLEDDTVHSEIVSCALLYMMSQRVNDAREMAGNFLLALRKQGCIVVKLDTLPVDDAFKRKVLQEFWAKHPHTKPKEA